MSGTEKRAIRPNKAQFVELCERARRRAGRDAQSVEVQGEGRRRRRERRRASTRKYGDTAVQMVGSTGRQGVVDGPRRPDRSSATPTEDWDSVALVEYPSRKAFIEMVTTPEYEKAHEHRESGLERTVLLACTEPSVAGELTDGSQHPLHHHRPAAVRRARMQRRDRSRARRWSTRSPPNGIRYERAYNQNTVCMPARSTMLTGQYVRTHGVDRERRAAARRRAERSPSTCTTRPATAPRCSARRTSSPASTGKLEWAENFMSERGLDRSVPRLRARRARGARAHVRQAAAPALRQVARRHARLRRDPGLLAAARGRARRRHRRARDAHQPDPARLVPHRLGGRSHDRVPRLAAATTTTGSCGCRSPTRTTRGIRPTSELQPLRLARPRPPRRSPRFGRGDRTCARAEARALARRSGRATSINAEGGPGNYRPQNGECTTASARSTR